MKLFVSGTRANSETGGRESNGGGARRNPSPAIPVASSSTDAGSGTRAAACEDLRSIGNVEIRPAHDRATPAGEVLAGMTMSRLLMPRDAIKPRT